MHIFVCNFSRHDTQTVELFILPKHRLVLCKFQGSLNISWSVAASFQNKTCTFISMHHICWCCSTNIWMCWRQNIVLNTSKNNAYLWKKIITKPRREIVREPGWTVLNRFEPLIYKHVSAQLIYKNKTTKQQSSFGTLTHTIQYDAWTAGAARSQTQTALFKKMFWFQKCHWAVLCRRTLLDATRFRGTCMLHTRSGPKNASWNWWKHNVVNKHDRDAYKDKLAENMRFKIWSMTNMASTSVRGLVSDDFRERLYDVSIMMFQMLKRVVTCIFPISFIKFVVHLLWKKDQNWKLDCFTTNGTVISWSWSSCTGLRLFF